MTWSQPATGRRRSSASASGRRPSASSTGGCPGLAGFEILRRLRADPGTDGIRVLILTATVDEERAIRRHGVEPDGFMKKPFEADGLLAEVERLLQ